MFASTHLPEISRWPRSSAGERSRRGAASCDRAGGAFASAHLPEIWRRPRSSAG